MMDKVAFGIDDLEDALRSAGSAIGNAAGSAYDYLGDQANNLMYALRIKDRPATGPGMFDELYRTVYGIADRYDPYTPGPDQSVLPSDWEKRIALEQAISADSKGSQSPFDAALAKAQAGYKNYAPGREGPTESKLPKDWEKRLALEEAVSADSKARSLSKSKSGSPGNGFIANSAALARARSILASMPFAGGAGSAAPNLGSDDAANASVVGRVLHPFGVTPTEAAPGIIDRALGTAATRAVMSQIPFQGFGSGGPGFLEGSIGRAKKHAVEGLIAQMPFSGKNSG